MAGIGVGMQIGCGETPSPTSLNNRNNTPPRTPPPPIDDEIAPAAAPAPLAVIANPQALSGREGWQAYMLAMFQAVSARDIASFREGLRGYETGFPQTEARRLTGPVALAEDEQPDDISWHRTDEQIIESYRMAEAPYMTLLEYAFHNRFTEAFQMLYDRGVSPYRICMDQLISPSAWGVKMSLQAKLPDQRTPEEQYLLKTFNRAPWTTIMCDTHLVDAVEEDNDDDAAAANLEGASLQHRTATWVSIIAASDQYRRNAERFNIDQVSFREGVLEALLFAHLMRHPQRIQQIRNWGIEIEGRLLRDLILLLLKRNDMTDALALITQLTQQRATLIYPYINYALAHAASPEVPFRLDPHGFTMLYLAIERRDYIAVAMLLRRTKKVDEFLALVRDGTHSALALSIRNILSIDTTMLMSPAMLRTHRHILALIVMYSVLYVSKGIWLAVYTHAINNRQTRMMPTLQRAGGIMKECMEIKSEHHGFSLPELYIQDFPQLPEGELERLFGVGFKARARNADGISLLRMAIERRNVHAVKALLKYDPALAIDDQDAVMAAESHPESNDLVRDAIHEYRQMVDGRPLCEYVASRNLEGVKQRLIQLSPQDFELVPEIREAFMYAIRTGRKKSATAIVEAYPQVLRLSNPTPMTVAIRAQCAASVTFLFVQSLKMPGVDYFVRNYYTSPEDDHPLSLAIQVDSPLIGMVVINYMKRRKLILDFRDKEGLTPLHRSILRQDFLFVNMLVRLGASAFVPSEAGQDAMEVAQNMAMGDQLATILRYTQDKSPRKEENLLLQQVSSAEAEAGPSSRPGPAAPARVTTPRRRITAMPPRRHPPPPTTADAGSGSSSSSSSSSSSGSESS